MSRAVGNLISGLGRQTGDTLTQLDDGTWEATAKFVCQWVNAFNLAPRRGYAKHPDFPALTCKSSVTTRLKPGTYCEINATYRGFFVQEPDPTTPPDPVNAINSTEEVTTSVSEAPIETHPKFTSVIGGKKGSELNGAVFNDDGTFKGWKSDSPYAGKEAYLIASTAYRRTTPTRSRPSSVGPVGRLDVQPGIASDVPNANWLFTCRSWHRDGAVYELSEEWMLSGPGGWDPVLYSP